MIKTVVLKKVEDGIKPPVSNPFPIFVHDVYSYAMSHFFTIDTGLELQLCDGLTLQIRNAPEMMTASWTMDGHKLPNSPQETEWPKGRLIVLMYGSFPKKGQKIGDVMIVKQNREPVRFVQHDPSGGRIVRGDAQVANSPENRKSKR